MLIIRRPDSTFAFFLIASLLALLATGIGEATDSTKSPLVRFGYVSKVGINLNII